MSILSVLFFIPFCRFRGNNRFEGERFPTEEVVLVFSCCVTSIVWKFLTTIIYLFHIKTWNFLNKNPRVFYSIFYRNKHRKQASFWLHNITKKQFSYSISRPNQLPKEKPNGNNPNNFSSIKLTRKKRTYVALLLSDANRTFLPTSLNSSPGAKLSNLSALHWTLPIPKTRKRLKCIHSQINSSKHIKINWFSDCKWSQHYSKFLSTIPHMRE